MRSRAGAVIAALLAVANASCGQKSPTPVVAHGSLAGSLARVGEVNLSPSLVAWLAGAKDRSPREALNDLVEDALLAGGAHGQGLDERPDVRWATASALARQVPEHLTADAAAMGPPTPDELAMVSVVHAVVMRTPGLREEDAVAVARAVRAAVVDAKSAEDFIARARAVPHPHAQLIAQSLPPFAADGRDESGARNDAGFVAAAFALHTPRETSPIVVSPFGWHVIQLVERVPERSPPSELTSAVVRMRGRASLDAVLRRRRGTAKIELSSSADEQMARAASAR